MMIFIKVSISCWFIGLYIFLKLGSAKGAMFVFFEVDTTRYSSPHVRNKIFFAGETAASQTDFSLHILIQAF